MNSEQKAIAKRLGIVAAILLVVVTVVYYIYSPKEPAAIAKIYPSGQRKAIAAVFRSGTWSIDSNGTGRWEDVAGGDSNLVLGKAGDIPLVGTWDVADGPSIGVFRDGVFTLLINGHPKTFNFGGPGDIPVVGDWNGDGRSKIGVFRKGVWLLDLNGNFKWDGPPTDAQVSLGGTPSEIPVVGDWNGDGKTDLGVYTADLKFVLDFNGNGTWDKDDKVFGWGAPGGIPLVGDWTGDGRSKIGAFRLGFWSLDANANQAWDGAGKDMFIALGGKAEDVPVVGDWNGDGKTKVGVYRQGIWYLDTDGNGQLDKTDKNWFFGLPGDTPLVIAPNHSAKK